MTNNNCWYCYFYKSGYMENACDYFGLENFPIQNNCDAFSTNGYVAPELEDKLFKESGGVYGKPLFDGFERKEDNNETT